MKEERSPGAERQQYYRWKHPQLNITFHSPEEEALVRHACHAHHQSPRDVLLAWAEQHPARPPRPPQPDVPNDSP